MSKITELNFNPGDILVSKYEVIEKLGAGWEGEVYRIREISTDIERGAKIFFSHRNIKNKTSRFYARKLHKLRQCQILIQYHNEELMYVDGVPLTILISEFVDGMLLSDFIQSFPGKRLRPYMALHLLYSLVHGIEEIHSLNEYHGDLHAENVIVNRFGLRFDLKLLDMFHWGVSTKANKQNDIISIIQLFHASLGGSSKYAQLPKEIKSICCGLKESLILKKFPHISRLREYIEKLELSAHVNG